MIKNFIISFILFFITLQTIVVDPSVAITAEERLEEVEKQLIAIANQIKQYEGDKTDLEKKILANDSALKKVNDELAEVQRRLATAQAALEKALEGYDESLNNLASVQQNIINEQVTLGVTKNEISKVKDESDALSINAETEPFKLPLLGNLFTKSLCFVVTTLVLVNLSTEPVAM